MFWSFCYVVLARLLQLAALRFRSEEFKELEIVVLLKGAIIAWGAQTQPRTESGRFAGRSSKCTARAKRGPA